MSARSPVGAPRQRFTSIAGFSDQKQIPRIGKLRLGVKEKKGTSSEHPRETDHFVLDLEDSVPPVDAKAITELFNQLYGERPQVITGVRLLTNTAEDSFSSAYEWWRSGKLFCHGNGDKALRKINNEWQDWTDANPCANTGCPDYGPKKCGLTSRLRVMLPNVSISGFFQIDTGSIYSAANIRNGINLAAALTTQVFKEPRLTQMPFTLLRAPQPIEFEGKLNTHFIIHLQPENLTLAGLTEKMGAIGAAQRQLTAGTPLIADVEDDLPAELVPESEHIEAEEFDPAAEDEINAIVDALRWNNGKIAAESAQHPAQAAYLVHVRAKLSEAVSALLITLGLSDRDVVDLRQKFPKDLDLIGELMQRWDALSPEVRKERAKRAKGTVAA